MTYGQLRPHRPGWTDVKHTDGYGRTWPARAGLVALLRVGTGSRPMSRFYVLSSQVRPHRPTWLTVHCHSLTRFKTFEGLMPSIWPFEGPAFIETVWYSVSIREYSLAAVLGPGESFFHPFICLDPQGRVVILSDKRSICHPFVIPMSVAIPFICVSVGSVPPVRLSVVYLPRRRLEFSDGSRSRSS